MKRLFKLASVLRKCSATNKNESDLVTNLRTAFPVVGVLVAAGLFYLTYHFSGMIESFGGAEAILSTTMLVVFSGCILLSVIDLINTLYMSTDLPILVVMPLTVYEIVGARLYNVLIKLVLFDAAILLPSCLGFGFGAGMSFSYYFTTLMGFVVIPLICIMMTSAVIILLMSVIRVFRNRDMVTIIGILCVPLVSIAYLYVRQYFVQEMSLSAIGNQALNAMAKVSGASVYVPVISFLTRFYSTGNILFLLGVLGMLLASGVILYLFIRFFYLKGALAMHTGSNRQGVMDLSAEKINKKSPVAALTKKELLLIFRTPAYLLYGWLCSTFWPLLMVIALIVMNTLSDVLSPIADLGNSVGSNADIGGIAFACYGAVFIALFTVATNNTAYTAISREGTSHFISKTIPITYEDQMRAKQNATLIICSMGSIFYTVVGMVFLMIKRLLPIWAVFPIMITLVATIVWGNGIQLWLGSRWPNLNWDDESVVGKDASKAFWIITILVTLLIPILMFITSQYIVIWLVALPLIATLLAFFIYRFSIRASAKVLAK